MYALGNIEKFVNDYPEEVGGQAEAIMQRARKILKGGVFSGISAEEIFGTKKLADEFERAFKNDLGHMEICMAVKGAHKK